jgi:hypothetical protein
MQGATAIKVGPDLRDLPFPCGSDRRKQRLPAKRTLHRPAGGTTK